jgi:NADPH:quinone reductase-like Zn-dependent oxidoreductase
MHMKAVIFTGAGGNEVVQVEDRPDPVPGSEDVCVWVTFAGLNPADLLQRAGRYPAPPGSPPDIPGLEVAGVVETCGDRVTSVRTGERVFGIIDGGGLSTRVLIHERCAVRVPDRLSERDAAAVPEAFVAAHDALRSQALLAPGETLLVHGASGGVGTAAVQIGALAGARVLGTVRSEAGSAAVRRLGGEPIADDGFAQAVLERTDGHGADVILELVGAPHFPGNLEVLAARGRIVIVGIGAETDIALNLFAVMQKRATLYGTLLRARPLEEKASAMRGFEREVVPSLANGRACAVIDSVYPIDAVRDAFLRLASPGKVGKVLVQF